MLFQTSRCSFLALNTMAFILFWRSMVCSGKSSSCLPLKIKLHSPSFIFPPFSTLSSSSSSCFTPSLNIISELLKKDCGFSSLQVTTVMRRTPQLLRNKSDQTAREVIHLLRDSGFTENKLKSVILRNSTILLLKVDSQLKPKMEFLKKVGLATQDIAHMVLRAPRLLALSLENSVAPRILHLETIFGSKVHLCKALRVAPQLLMSDFERQVKPKAESLKNSIGILEGSTTFARALNAVLGLSFETLEAKTKHMSILGLSEEEIGQILKRNPHVLRYSTKKIKESIDFLMHTAGLEPRIVALYSPILGLSVEKRLKPRYQVFKSLRTSSHAKDLPSLARFFMLGEREFLAKFSKYNTLVKSNGHCL